MHDIPLPAAAEDNPRWQKLLTQPCPHGRTLGDCPDIWCTSRREDFAEHGGRLPDETPPETPAEAHAAGHAPGFCYDCHARPVTGWSAYCAECAPRHTTGTCKCGARWTGARPCHCATCHLTFTSIGPFDYHRAGPLAARRCRTQAELRDAGYAPNARGQWRKPAPAGLWPAPATREEP